MTDEKRIEEIRALLAKHGRAGTHEKLRIEYAIDRRAIVTFRALLSALDAERARAVRAEAERDARPDPAALPNLDDHPLQDPAAANRELRKLLYTVDADRKRADAKIRELTAEVDRLRAAMPAMDEVGAARGVLRYVGHSGAHGDICDYADVLSGWLDRIEKARGG